MGAPPTDLITPQDLKTNAEIAKINLEIQSLQKKSKWEPILQFSQVLVAAVAVLGFLVGAYRYQNEQDRDRATRALDQRLRVQSQMRTNVDELLRFTRDKETISRASFLLEDLRTILASPLADGQTVATLFPDYERRFTQSLVYQLAYDSDFQTNAKEISLAETALDRWSDYGKYLREHPDKFNKILYKHVRALRYLCDSNSDYINTMTIEDGRLRVLPEYETKEGEEERYNHLRVVGQSFKGHLDLLTKEASTDLKKIRDEKVSDFENALCKQKCTNKEVARFFLQNYFVEGICPN